MPDNTTPAEREREERDAPDIWDDAARHADELMRPVTVEEAEAEQ